MIRDWHACSLSRREQRVLRALAEGLYDPNGTGKLGAVFEHVLDEVEAWLAAPERTVRCTLRALLFVIELSPIGFGFGVHAMSQLPLHDRVGYLARLEEAGATSLSIWKTLLGTAYFDHPVGASDLGLATTMPSTPTGLEHGASHHQGSGLYRLNLARGAAHHRHHARLQ